MFRELRHRDGLDGIRAIAIASVIGLHAISRVFPGGGYGVDIFFTLSSFLISCQILTNLHVQNRFDFRSFYVRRAARLGPALALWLAIIAAPTAILVHESGKILFSTLASLFYFGNVAVAFGHGIGNAYTHIWSLAIEEQFYLLWPITFVYLWRKWPTRMLRRAAATALLLAVPLQYFAGRQLGVRNYFLPSGHVIAIAAGVWAAVTYTYGKKVIQNKFVVSATTSIALLGIAVSVVTHSIDKSYAVVVVAIVSAAVDLLILTIMANQASYATRLLALPIMTWVGKRSYGLYLYHRSLSLAVPALTHLTLRLGGPLTIFCSLVLAEVSYRYVEQPVVARAKAWGSERTAA